MQFPTRLAAVAAMTSALVLSGCAAVQPDRIEPAAPAVDQTVEMVGFSFVPETIRIAPGQTVQWRNTSASGHTVTADPALAEDPANVALPQSAQAFHSGPIAPGETWQKTFEVAGTYRYVCLPHERLGMTGTVVVEPQ